MKNSLYLSELNEIEAARKSFIDNFHNRIENYNSREGNRQFLDDSIIEGYLDDKIITSNGTVDKQNYSLIARMNEDESLDCIVYGDDLEMLVYSADNIEDARHVFKGYVLSRQPEDRYLPTFEEELKEITQLDKKYAAIGAIIGIGVGAAAGVLDLIPDIGIINEVVVGFLSSAFLGALYGMYKEKAVMFRRNGEYSDEFYKARFSFNDAEKKISRGQERFQMLDKLGLTYGGE